jgi:hypothetical protein
MNADGTLRFACTECGERAIEPGACPRCNADALMDVVDPEQRRVLERIDRQRMRTRSNRLKSVAVLIGIFAGGFLFGLLAIAGLDFGHFVVNWIVRIAGSAVIAGGAWAVLERLFGDARRYPFLDDPLPKAKIANRD